jgi:hypothetical protein
MKGQRNMTSTIESESHVDGDSLAREGDGWIAYRKPQPAIEPLSIDLLSLSAESQPGNLRFAIDREMTLLIAELRDAEHAITFDEARRLLFEAAPRDVDETFHDEVAMALRETGCEWSPVEERPGQWRAVVEDSRNNRCELSATIVDGGVDVRGRLTSWEIAPSELSQTAMRRFLAHAHARLRFVRFTLQGDQASALSFAAADRIDVELPDCVEAVLVGHRMAWREVASLANEAIARSYLERSRRLNLE